MSHHPTIVRPANDSQAAAALVRRLRKLPNVGKLSPTSSKAAYERTIVHRVLKTGVGKELKFEEIFPTLELHEHGPDNAQKRMLHDNHKLALSAWEEVIQLMQ